MNFFCNNHAKHNTLLQLFRHVQKVRQEIEKLIAERAPQTKTLKVKARRGSKVIVEIHVD